MGPTRARVPEWDVGLTPLGDKLGDFSDEVQATGRLGQTDWRLLRLESRRPAKEPASGRSNSVPRVQSIDVDSARFSGATLSSWNVTESVDELTSETNRGIKSAL